MRVANHAQLLIRGLSRFSTNIRPVSQVLTDALLSTTVYFSALTRARVKLHTTPNKGVSGFSTNMRSVSTTLTDASLYTTESFSAVCVLLCFVDPILGNLTVRGHSLSQGTWGCRILTLHLNYVAGYCDLCA